LTGDTRPKALVFDWDNTLVDSWEVIHAANAYTFEAMGKRPWTLEETRRNVAKSMRDAYPELFGDRWEEAREIFYARYEAIHMDYIRPIDGALDALEAFGDMGITLAIVSNKTASYLRKEADALGWTGHFTRILGAGDLEKDKPDPMVVHAALEGITAGPDCWFVGDNAIDMECGYRAGCSTVLMHDNELSPEKAEKWPPHRQFSGFSSLVHEIEKLNVKQTA
jgi:phosphoglycolate phosphatase